MYILITIEVPEQISNSCVDISMFYNLFKYI